MADHGTDPTERWRDFAPLLADGLPAEPPVGRVELPVGAVFTGPTVEEIATALVTAALAEESGQAAGNGGVQR